MENKGTIAWALFKTAIFTLVVPGSVAILLPHLVFRQSGNGVNAWNLGGWKLVGYLPLTAGVAIYLWCAWDFVTKGMGTPLPIDPPRVLVVKGLYRYTRNPMYVGVLSMIVGQALFYGSRSIGVYGCIVLTGFYLFVLLYEEPALRRLFGEQYEQYCRTVPRWIFRFRRA